MSTAQPSVGAIPISVSLPLASYMGQAENLMPQPHGNSDENGIPHPPPVVAPIMVTCGSCFINATKSLAALKVDRFVRTATGFPHIMCPASAGL